VDGRKAYCSALLTSCPPLVPGERFYSRSSASNSSGAEDTQPMFPDANTVISTHATTISVKFTHFFLR
jgi:hypothetical protein